MELGVGKGGGCAFYAGLDSCCMWGSSRIDVEESVGGGG